MQYLIKIKNILKIYKFLKKNFNFLINPSIANLKFAKLINNNKIFKDISLEIISKKTDLKKISISLNKFRGIFN